MISYEEHVTEYETVFIKKTEQDGKTWFIPKDPANSDYQAYLASLENGTIS